MPLTAAEKKRLLKNRARRTATMRGSARAVQTPAEKRRAASVAKLEAERQATAKRLSGQTATTQAQLRARQAATRTVPRPPTRSQEAAALRQRLQPEGLRRLGEALKPKKKKKD